jgi:hypothetical protein
MQVQDSGKISSQVRRDILRMVHGRQYLAVTRNQ